MARSFYPLPRLVALLENRRHFLLVRDFSGGIPQGPYHLPCSAGKDFKALQRDVASLYRGEIALKEELPPFALEKAKIRPMLIKESLPLRFEKGKTVGKFFSEKELSDVFVDPVDRAYLEYLFAFLPLYFPKGVLPLEEGDYDKARGLVSAAYYFHSVHLLPKEAYEEFHALFTAQVCLAALQKAFQYLLSRYGLDPNEYLDALHYQNHK